MKLPSSRTRKPVSGPFAASLMCDLATDVRRLVTLGRGDLDDRVVTLVVLEVQRPRDHGVHRVHHRDVRELHDRLVAEVLAHRVEHRVVHATEAEDEGVGVGEQRPLERLEEVGHLPRLERFDLLLREAQGATGLAVLREDELAADQPARPGLTELTQLGTDLALRAGVQREAAAGVLEHVGRVGEHRPPVTGGTGGGAGLGYRITVTEQPLVHRLDELRVDLTLGISRSRGTAGLYTKCPGCARNRPDRLTRSRRWCAMTGRTRGEDRMAASKNTNTEFELRGFNHLALVARDMAET